MDTLNKAIKLATQVHDGQKDKRGRPYILHCIEVMHELNSFSSEECMSLNGMIDVDITPTVDLLMATKGEDMLLSIAVLHDALEDNYNNVPTDHVINGELFRHVNALTKKPDQKRTEYIRNLLIPEIKHDHTNWVEVIDKATVAVVKYCDLTCNLRSIDLVPDSQTFRNRYIREKALLKKNIGSITTWFFETEKGLH